MVDVTMLYSRLPVLLQHAACSLEGWRIQRQRYGGFPALLRVVEERGFWSEERLADYRHSRLRAFLRHATQAMPLYSGLPVSSSDVLRDLGSWPILTKSQLQGVLGGNSQVMGADHRLVHTSGTTGGGLRFFSTRRALQEQWAVWWRYRRWHGIDPGTPCGYFGGRSVVPLPQRHPPYWRYDVPGRQILFSGYHTAEHHLAAMVAELRRARPPWLHGYPSLLALLAAFVLDRKTDLGYQMRWITTGAENLLPQQASLIFKAFGIHARQHYGMAEAVANASECELGRLHVDEDFSFVEFLPSGDGFSHRVIGTNFSNPATPLIRYEVQDRVILGSRCPCGRPGRVLERVDGRQEDYVVLSNGTRLGRLDHIFKDAVSIREAQIVQTKSGEVVLRIVPTRQFGHADEERLLREARQRLGPETTIRIERVETIPRTSSGKLRFVLSEPGRLDRANGGYSQ